MRSSVTRVAEIFKREHLPLTSGLRTALGESVTQTTSGRLSTKSADLQSSCKYMQPFLQFILVSFARMLVFFVSGKHPPS